MILRLLGTGTSLPAVERASPGLHLTIAGERILIDPGPGTLRRLAAEGLDFEALDAVAVTHRHLDHTLDLLHLFFALMVIDHRPEGGRRAPLLLFGFPGLADFLERLGSAYGDWVAPAGHARPVVELAPGAVFERGSWRVRAEAMDHLPESIGFRFESSAGVLAVTGDTEYGPGAVALARDADLLVSECSAPDDAPIPRHLTPAGVARIALESSCRRIVLVHLNPGLDGDALAEAVRAHGRAAGRALHVEAGRDGAEYRLPTPD